MPQRYSLPLTVPSTDAAMAGGAASRLPANRLAYERVMTIHRLIQNLSFNQDDIDRLAAAYEDALRALHISDLSRRRPILKAVLC